MQLSPNTAMGYIYHAFAQMLDLVDALDEDLLNKQPLTEGTNAISALVVHCCAVTEYWLGHVGLGRPSTRERDAEFTTVATSAACRELVEASLHQAAQDLTSLDQRAAVSALVRNDLPAQDGSTAGVTLHVLEELFQHLGQMQLTRDVLSARASEMR